MSIINNSHAIGVDTRNLVLKTKGTLHVKVGDSYYEIDFRNLIADKEKDEDVKEEFIISIDNKNAIDKLEYPGDNKLIIGLDGSLFVTKDGSIIEIESKSTVINNTFPTTIQETMSFNDIVIKGAVHGSRGGKIDFTNNTITVDSIYTKELNIPNTASKFLCGSTYVDESDYKNLDFLEITNDSPETLFVKSGVMLKNTTDEKVNKIININGYDKEVELEEKGFYIAYANSEINITKLN